MTHGGPRPGAGRPPGTTKPTSKRRQVNVRLTDAEIAKAETLGGGNASEGIRRALENASCRNSILAYSILAKSHFGF